MRYESRMTQTIDELPTPDEVRAEFEDGGGDDEGDEGVSHPRAQLEPGTVFCRCVKFRTISGLRIEDC